MTAEEMDTLIQQYKDANAAIEAKIAALQARSVLSDQQLAELKAEIVKTMGLAAGKS